MALSTPSGWNNPRVEYVEQHKSDAYVCCHCNRMLYQPRQVTCGHRLCSPCLDELLSTTQEIMCPANDEGCEMINKYNSYPDMATYRDMCKMMVYCPNKDSGCEHTCKFTELQNHLEQCTFRSMNCPVEGCEFTGGPKAIDAHMEESAVRHTTLLAAALATVSSKHQQELQLLREENKKLQGGKELMQQLQEQNQQLSETNQAMQRRLEKVESELIQVRQKCSDSSAVAIPDDMVTRLQQLEVRQQGHELELKKIFGVVANDRARMTGYNVKGAQNTVYTTVFTWHITNYTQRKKDEIEGRVPYLDSEVFYCNNYKMCARLYLNGDGIGRGSNLSLYISLLKGDNDDQLLWPFRHRICMVLVNQINPNQKIVQEQFDPVPTSISYQKPKSRNKGTGFPLFSTHALAESAQSLVNDSIKILVQVDSAALS